MCDTSNTTTTVQNIVTPPQVITRVDAAASAANYNNYVNDYNNYLNNYNSYVQQNWGYNPGYQYGGFGAGFGRSGFGGSSFAFANAGGFGSPLLANNGFGSFSGDPLLNQFLAGSNGFNSGFGGVNPFLGGFGVTPLGNSGFGSIGGAGFGGIGDAGFGNTNGSNDGFFGAGLGPAAGGFQSLQEANVLDAVSSILRQQAAIRRARVLSGLSQAAGGFQLRRLFNQFLNYLANNGGGGGFDNGFGANPYGQPANIAISIA